MLVPATYVSVWDNGEEIRSECHFNTKTREVINVDTVDVSEMDLEILDEEYVELYTGEIIKDFIGENGDEYRDGQKVE